MTATAAFPTVTPLRPTSTPARKTASAKPKARPRKRAARAIAIPKRQRRLVRQLLACLAAGFLPVASYVLVHAEASAGKPWLYALVACALAFSAPTLADWAHSWCSGKLKAWGFTLLLEGVMIVSTIPALNLAGLLILVAINSAYAWERAAITESARIASRPAV